MVTLYIPGTVNMRADYESTGLHCEDEIVRMLSAAACMAWHDHGEAITLTSSRPNRGDILVPAGDLGQLKRMRNVLSERILVDCSRAEGVR